MTRFWVFFNLFILMMLAIDLGVFNRKAHTVKTKEALIWTAVWVTLALIFNVIVYFWRGPDDALRFLTGYLIEYSLSIDNIFIFLMIFTYFRVPAERQHKVLFWGILGALLMRALFIALGVALIQRFHWMIYVFGAFLVYTGYKMAVEKDKEIHPEKNPVLRIFRKMMPVTPDYVGSRFFVRIDKRIFATPLFVVLLIVETTDVIFALDSIPAILAITSDSFIVYTSNVFAILGLRSLYFAVAGLMRLFHYLNYGLSAILAFVGVKMLISGVYHISIVTSLLFIVASIAVSITASVIWPKKTNPVEKP